VSKPSGTTSERLAAAITVLFKAIWPIPVGLAGLTIALYQGLVAKEANYTASGLALIMMGFAAGGIFDAFTNGKKAAP
jgi:hypothetical protein